MRDLTMLADDLTGALDAAAAFASVAQPVEVGWGEGSGDRVVVDTETRGVTRAAARARVEEFLPALAGSRVAFKKVDSLLRGNSFAEIAACCRLDLFDAIYITPAFPSQGRTVAGGTLHTDIGRTVSVVAGLAAEGIAGIAVAAGSKPPPSGVAVCDTTTERDLLALVGHVDATRRILWCGSAGLARVVGGEASIISATPTLAIVGSRHPVTGRQTAALSASMGAACVRIADANDILAACAAVDSALRSVGKAALLLDLPQMSDDAADYAYRATFEALGAVLARPEAIIAVGGDTLFRLVGTLGARALRVLGERSPGVPVSRLDGGLWHGTLVVSKSGAFADAGLFQDFVHGEFQSA